MGSFFIRKKYHPSHAHRTGLFRSTTALPTLPVGVTASPWMWAKARSKLGALIRLCGDGAVSNQAKLGVTQPLQSSLNALQTANTQTNTLATTTAATVTTQGDTLTAQINTLNTHTNTLDTHTQQLQTVETKTSGIDYTNNGVTTITNLQTTNVDMCVTITKCYGGCSGCSEQSINWSSDCCNPSHS
jgi:hypothetical protein